MNKDNDINIGSIKDDVEKAKELIQKMRNKRVIQVRETWNDDYGYIKALENIVSDYTRQKQINEEHKKQNAELMKAINTLEKEKGDWIKAYQEEKDKQFDILRNSINCKR